MTIPRNLFYNRAGHTLANETVAAWRVALADRTEPTALIFSRQSIPTQVARMPETAIEIKKVETGKGI